MSDTGTAGQGLHGSRRFLLHIGIYKTGSTAIQAALAGQRPQLLAQGVCYPRSLGRQVHTDLTDLLSAAVRRNPEAAKQRMLRGQSAETRIAELRAEFDEEMRALPASVHTVILSAEDLCRSVTQPVQFDLLREMIAPHAKSVEVVVYLRRQDEHYASAYTQLLRMGVIHAPNPRAPHAWAESMWEYEALLDRWAAAFGDAAMRPRIFEQPEGGRFDVVEDFFDVAGISLSTTVAEDDPSTSEAGVETARAARRGKRKGGGKTSSTAAAFEEIAPAGASKKKASANPSPSAAGLEVIRRAGELLQNRDEKSGRARSPLWNSLTAAVTRGASGRGWRADPQSAQVLLDRYAEMNERVRQRWFPDRPYLFRPLPPGAETAAAPSVDDHQAITEAAISSLIAACEHLTERQRTTYEQRAEICMLREDYPGAKIALAARLSLDRDHIPSRIALAEIHLKLGENAQARAVLNKLAAEVPGNRQVKRMLAGLDGAPSGMGKAKKR